MSFHVYEFYSSPTEVFHGTLFVMAVIVFWVLPIVLGIRCARRKRYSPHWMWFGVHPLGGWCVFIVLTALPARRICGTCGGYVAEYFRLCPYCHASMENSANVAPH